LRLQLADRDKALEDQKKVIKQIEVDYRARSHEFEQRLQDQNDKIRQLEMLLSEKETLVRAAAAKEAQLGKLIERLSVECKRLYSELEEKNQPPAPVESKKNPSVPDNNFWRYVLRPLPRGN